MRGALAQAGARRVLAWALPPSYHAHLFVSIEKPLLPAARCVARGRGAPPLGVDHARQTLAYVADAIYSETNIERIVGLAKGADLFYCEAAFLDRDVLRDATAELYAEARAAFEGALAVLPAVGASGGMERRGPMTRDEIRAHVGKRVTLKLTPQAPGGPTVTGRIEGVLDAVDGLLVTVIPDGSASAARTIHYHYIETISPAP